MRLDNFMAAAAAGTVIVTGVIMKIPLLITLVSSAAVGGGLKLISFYESRFEKEEIQIDFSCKRPKKITHQEQQVNANIEETANKKTNFIIPLLGRRLLSINTKPETMTVTDYTKT